MEINIGLVWSAVVRETSLLEKETRKRKGSKKKVGITGGKEKVICFNNLGIRSWISVLIIFQQIRIDKYILQTRGHGYTYIYFRG